MNNIDKYTEMQQAFYREECSKWSLANKNPVVGSFDWHNQWTDYDDYLFHPLVSSDSIAIEFGCGPGRNLVRWAKRFRRIDGCDIDPTNLVNAKIYLSASHLPVPNLYLVNGQGMNGVPSSAYDLVFSTICMQHICVYTIRRMIIQDMFRVLKPGGWICIQMGFGGRCDAQPWARYYEDIVDATGTNGLHDVSIEDQKYVEQDLAQIGFVDFHADIRPRHPSDAHNYWIYFQARKPL